MDMEISKLLFGFNILIDLHGLGCMSEGNVHLCTQDKMRNMNESRVVVRAKR